MSDAREVAMYGRYNSRQAATVSVVNWALDASTDGWGAIWQALSANAITHLGFRYGVRTGTPPTYRISLQSPDASALPDGTVLGGGSPASATFTPPADATWNSTWQWIALDNAYTPTRGQVLCSVIEWSSGTVDGSNHSTITETHSIGEYGVRGFSGYRRRTAGTWSKPVYLVPVYGVRTASERYGEVYATEYATTTSTSGHRHALRFTLPAGFGDTYRIAGISALINFGASGSTFKLGLWDGTTEIQSATIDNDVVPASGQRTTALYFADTTLDTLSFGTEYRIGIESISSSQIGLKGYQLASADDRVMFPLGSSRGLSTWNGSVWTDDDTVMPELNLILDDITEPAGGSNAYVIGS